MGSIDALKTAGPYQLAERLGGNDAVASYKGLHSDSGMNACIVVVDGDQFADPNAWSYFQQEFGIVRPQQASRLAQPIESGDSPDNVYWCAFEYLKGAHLGSIVRDHGLPSPARAVEIIKQALEATQKLHSYGVAYRVITPASIFINDLEQVKLLHAGWSRLLLSLQGGAAHPDLMSNLPFLAPEVASAQASDAAADIYSLGANLYFLLCGQPTHWADDPAELVQIICDGTIDFDAPREYAPAEAVELVEELLQKDPEDRPLNLEALHARMDEMVGRLYLSQADAASSAPGSIEQAFEDSEAPGPLPPPGAVDVPPSEEEPVAPVAPPELPPMPEPASEQSPPTGPPPGAPPLPDYSDAPGPSAEPAVSGGSPSGGEPSSGGRSGKKDKKKLLLILGIAIGGPLVLCVLGWATMAVMGGLFGSSAGDGASAANQKPSVATPTPTPRPPKGEELLPYIATLTLMLETGEVSHEFFRENGRHAYNTAELLPGYDLAPAAAADQYPSMDEDTHARNVRVAYDGWDNAFDVREEFIFSAGPDEEWDTKDDIWLDSRKMELGWLKPKMLDQAAETPEADQLKSLLVGVTVVGEDGFTP